MKNEKRQDLFFLTSDQFNQIQSIVKKIRAVNKYNIRYLNYIQIKPVDRCAIRILATDATLALDHEIKLCSELESDLYVDFEVIGSINCPKQALLFFYTEGGSSYIECSGATYVTSEIDGLDIAKVTTVKVKETEIIEVIFNLKKLSMLLPLMNRDGLVSLLVNKNNTTETMTVRAKGEKIGVIMPARST
tara:strand:+ start:47229 stop:47798 length:570 start_codon:yes stop_codon:yes gene_type:complete